LKRITAAELPGGDVLLALEAAVARVPVEEWSSPGEGGDLTHLFGSGAVADKLAVAESRGPVAHLAILRGLVGALRKFYDEVKDAVALKAGSPVPFATGRRVNKVFHTTPRLETIGKGDLLREFGFYLFDPGLDESIPVILNFEYRDRLDQLTWKEREALPRIATIHPRLGKEGLSDPEDQTESWFFGLRPQCEPGDLLKLLASVAKEAAIAVLPELSLPASDALEKALADDPGAYPPLVVAGSAHVKEAAGSVDEVRANESRIYLEGALVAIHRKIHPFVLRKVGETELPQPLDEGITNEPKPLTILAGDSTRLGVTICADLNDARIPNLLERAGVNLLLMPALTPDPGAFNGGLCQLASRCQAVAVIVNGDGEAIGVEDPSLFAVMAAVPRSPANQQSTEYVPPTGLPAVGVLDPNQPLDKAIDWR
jgi:hypothetical protein